MRRIIKEKDDIKVSIFNGCRLAHVFIYKKKAKGEVNYRWRTRCPELVDKIVKHRTKVFTGQLIQLAKAYGEKKVIKYQKEEEEVCQDTIETR